MRIVAGKLRHRIIDMTNLETTRETQDKVRGAIYNSIGPYFDGGVCLDLFAGSGAMAIEAYSRGMTEIHMVDLNRNALEVCKKNCKSLGIINAKFFNADYEKFLLDSMGTSTMYDLIILDPPYKMNDISHILECVYPFVKPNGTVVFEMAKESEAPDALRNLVAKKEKFYGIKKVIVYRRDEDEKE